MKTTVLLALLLSSSAFADNADICAGYNFTPGTPEFGNCQMQLDMADRQQAQQQAAQRQEAVQRMYRPIVIPPATYNYQIPANHSYRPLPRQQTNCQWIGSVWNCQ